MTLRRILLSFSVAFSLLLIFGFAPSWDGLRIKYESWRESIRLKEQREQAARNRQLNEQPPAMLPVRPGDRARYPRQTFAIRYVDENGFGIDTASGMANFDRITDADTMIALRLTDARLDSLYEEALHDRMFEMQQPGYLSGSWGGSEHWGGELTLWAGGSSRVFRWDFWNPTASWTDDHKRLDAFVATLKRMVVTSSEYRKMPPPKGAYID